MSEATQTLDVQAIYRRWAADVTGRDDITNVSFSVDGDSGYSEETPGWYTAEAKVTYSDGTRDTVQLEDVAATMRELVELALN